MPMTNSTPQLMGAAEISDLFGISRQRVQQLINKPDFPAAFIELAMGKIWRTEDIHAWGIATERLHDPVAAPTTTPAGPPEDETQLYMRALSTLPDATYAHLKREAISRAGSTNPDLIAKLVYETAKRRGLLE